MVNTVPIVPTPTPSTDYLALAKKYWFVIVILILIFLWYLRSRKMHKKEEHDTQMPAPGSQNNMMMI
jgi:hypothetical protein